MPQDCFFTLNTDSPSFRYNQETLFSYLLAKCFRTSLFGFNKYLFLKNFVITQTDDINAFRVFACDSSEKLSN